MGYVLEEQPTNQQPVQLDAEDDKARRAPQRDDKGKEVVTPEEAERRKVVQAKWEKLLGKWLGGEMSKLVLEHVSLDALNGYVTEAIGSAGPQIGKAIKGQTNPTAAQAKALGEFNTALEAIVTGQVEKWMNSDTAQGVLKSVSNWVQGNPGATMAIIGTALIGGAVAVWFTNPDLDFDIPLSLGKNWKMEAGLDLGKLQSIGFQGASLMVANKTSKLTAKAGYKRSEDDDGTSKQSAELAVSKGDKGKESFTLALNGTITETKDGAVAHTAGGKLVLMNPKTGAKVSLSSDNKWDSSGAQDLSANFTASTGKDAPFSGSLSIGGKSVTIVDENGNIVETTSGELKLAVGSKANKFEATAKTENKDGVETHSLTVGGSAQLGKGLFSGTAGVHVGEETTTVKLNGKMQATVAGKPVTLSGSYETDGAVTGKIRIGEGNKYREVTGTKNGDVVTFSTKQVFENQSLEMSTTANADGTYTNKANASVTQGDHTFTLGGGSDGTYAAGWKGKLGDHASGNAHVNQDGFGAGVKYEEGFLKAHLDYTMNKGVSSLGGGLGVKMDNGLLAEVDATLDEARLTTLGIRLGYRDPDVFKSFIVSYKSEWQAANQQHAHKFGALLEYSAGNWLGRLDAGVDLRGNKVQSTSLDLTLGRKINQDWTAIGGMQYGNSLDATSGNYENSFKPYLGAQYKGIGVAGFYDTKSKGAGLMLTIPLGR